MKRITTLLILPLAILLASFVIKDDFLKTLEKKLTTFFQNNSIVKLHLYFSQPEYAAGDTAYFKMTFLHAKDNSPVPGRQIITVKVLDQSGKLVDFQQVTTKDGFGFNQFVIPKSLSPGIYTIAAYSDWMKNYDTGNFFYGQLMVANEKRFQYRSPSILEIFPEGGSLVAGLKNKVVIKGAPGVNVAVITRDGNEVANVTLDSDGYGSFIFAPTLQEYFALPRGGTRMPFPNIINTGVRFQLDPVSSTNQIEINFQKTSGYAMEDPYYFVIASNDKIHYTTKLDFRREDAYAVSVPHDELASGVLSATLFRANGSVLEERLFYLQEINHPITSLQLSKDAFDVREKVTVKIKITDGAGNPQSARIGARVFSKTLLADVERNNSLQNFLNLESDVSFSGVEKTDLSTLSPAAMDNFLITKRRTQFSWEEVQNEVKKKEFEFRKSLRVKGQVVLLPSAASQTLPDSTVVLFFLQRDVSSYKARVDKEGKFDVPMYFDFAGDDEVFYRIESKGKVVDDAVVRVPVDDFSVDLPLVTKTETVDSYGIFSKQKNLVNASFRAGGALTLPTALNPHAWIEEEIFGPDVSVKMKDYVVLPTMEEIIREIIPFVQLRKVDQHIEPRIWIRDLKVMAQDHPLYFIDGVITDNNEYFMSLRPEDITVIQALITNRKLTTFGPLGKNGFILVETSIPNNAANVPRSAHSFKVKGLNPKFTYHPMVHEKNQNTRTPDLRSNLYWNPDITTDENGEAEISFYTADNTGEFKIQLDGITASGQAIVGEKSFDVKFTRNAAVSD